MEPLDISITHKVPAFYKLLLARIRFLQSRLDSEVKRRQQLEIKYGDEVLLNNRLIDLCRLHGIPWRR